MSDAGVLEFDAEMVSGGRCLRYVQHPLTKEFSSNQTLTPARLGSLGSGAMLYRIPERPPKPF